MDDPLKPIIFSEEGFTLNFSHSGITAGDVTAFTNKIDTAHQEMKTLENGAIKNIDEQRKVTHFNDRITYPKSRIYHDVNNFFTQLSAGKIVGSTGKKIEYVVFNGIGGSALGPQLVQSALNGPYWNELSVEQRNKYPRIYFLDNTDSAGFCDTNAVVELDQSLIVTISKSGSTQETKNNLFAFEQVYNEQNLEFNKHAAAITMKGSELDQYARNQDWLTVWPMAESIGGRTSVTAIVGHVPAAAAGINFAELLNGAIMMDEWTRNPSVYENPAYLLALNWYILGDGKGDKNMVILPYSDRLILLSRYLQQLVMESLGKELDRNGNIVCQGLNVFGNKGGTDAHAFVQQLNDGRNDFFVTFIEILNDAKSIVVENDFTLGDFLHNFQVGLTSALSQNRRRVISITFESLNAKTLGMLIALYERAVAFYAELININAFHQPGVQAYKKAADKINDLNKLLRNFIENNTGFQGTAAEIAEHIDCPDHSQEIEGVLSKFVLNKRVFNNNTVERSLINKHWSFSIT